MSRKLRVVIDGETIARALEYQWERANREDDRFAWRKVEDYISSVIDLMITQSDWYAIGRVGSMIDSEEYDDLNFLRNLAAERSDMTVRN